MDTKTSAYIDGDTIEFTTIDYSAEKGPFWFVVCDETPTAPERPLPLAHALREFERAAQQAIEDGDGEVVELRQCTDEDLEWAGVTPAGSDDD
ncbi:hypothetical protein ABZW49_10775 [Nonomuraea wenchangensis]